MLCIYIYICVYVNITRNIIPLPRLLSSTAAWSRRHPSKAASAWASRVLLGMGNLQNPGGEAWCLAIAGFSRCRAAVLCRLTHSSDTSAGPSPKLNIPKPRLGALLVDLVAPALLCTRESLGTGVSGCCMMYKQMAQTDWGCSAGALILLRLHCHEGTTATARCLHGQDQDSLNCSEDKTLSATLPASWPSRPRWRRCASPRKGPDRWQAN